MKRIHKRKLSQNKSKKKNNPRKFHIGYFHSSSLSGEKGSKVRKVKHKKSMSS